MSKIRSVASIAASLLAGTLAAALPAAASPAAAPTWSASTPTVAHAPITALVGITCVTSSDCWAVGNRFKTASSHSGPALIEHYDGHGWNAVAAAPAQAGTLDQLSGVSCLSATNCWAVGQRSGLFNGNLLEHSGAHGWTAVATPASQGALGAVACEPSVSQCWAVGSTSSPARVITLHLVNGSWHEVAAAPTAALSYAQASGVACATPDDCLLVGFATPVHGLGFAVAERWDGGSWKRVAVPGQLSAGGSLAGVTCRPGHSPSVCWAVGQTAASGSGLRPIRPLVERWNGSAFTLISSPKGGVGDYPELEAIACGAATSCQAVGSRGSGEDEALVLTEGWNGSAWSKETSPSPLHGFQSLTGVSCPLASDCWAVGEGQNKAGTGGGMIIEHYSRA